MTKKFFLVKTGGVFLLCLLLLTSGCFKKKPVENFVDDTSPAIVDSSSNVNVAPKAEDYQADLKEILKSYWLNGNTVGVKNKILALTTPAEFLNLHLDLVIAFELIEQGNKNNDQDKIAEGTTKLDQLKANYSWIANY